MTNKELVLKVYEEVFNNWDLSNIDEYMRDDYMQHNPTAKDGKEGFKEFMGFFLGLKPHVEIIKVFENSDDEVCIFFKCQLANGSVNKVIDIYRIQDGKLAEHWDVIQHDIKEFDTVSGRSQF